LLPHHGARCPDYAKNRKRKWGEKPGSQLQLLKVFAEVQSRQLLNHGKQENRR
jgi:hypothetical protein